MSAILSNGRRLFPAGPALAVSILMGVVTSIVASADVPRECMPGGAGLLSSPTLSVRGTLGEPSCGYTAGNGFTVHLGFHAVTRAPSGSIHQTTGVAGEVCRVLASLEDDIAVQHATLFYRPGGSRQFASIPMAEAGGVWQGDIPASRVSVNGLQYYIEVADDLLTVSCPRSGPQAPAEARVSVSGHEALSLEANVYQLGGMSLELDNSAPLGVFDELGPYDTDRWRYGTWSPELKRYQEFPDAAVPGPGIGFWIIASQFATIQVDGHSTGLADPFTVDLQPGFNQIANPFAFPLDFAALELPEGTERNLIAWTGRGYEPEQIVLKPFTGYWLYHAGGQATTLILPPSATTGSKPTETTAATQSASSHAANWAFRLTATAGKFSDVGNRLGMTPGASVGRDHFDLTDAPNPPAGYISLSLRSPDGRRLLRDVRGWTPGGETWDVVLESDLIGEQYTIQFAGEGTIPHGWSVVAFDLDDLGESTLTHGGAIRGTVETPTFNRTWLVATGPQEYIARVRSEVLDDESSPPAFLSLGLPRPNPLVRGQGLVIPVEVPAATRASLRVIAPSGRLVHTLFDGMLNPGDKGIEWTVDERSRRRLAAGVYMLLLTTPEHREVRKLTIVD